MIVDVIERGSLVGAIRRATRNGHYEVDIVECPVGDYHKLGDVVIWDKTSKVTQKDIKQRDAHCRYCHRPLTDEISIFHGYGPDCAAQRGLPWGVTSELEELAT